MKTGSDNDYLKRVQTIFLGDIVSAELIKSGWSNVVVDVNQSQIFRFIRHPGRQFELEKAFLKSFAPESPIPIPNPTIEAEDFIAYPRLAGERFAPEKFAALSAEHQELLLRQLGRFLSALHGLDFSHPHLAQFPYGGADFWQDLWEPAESLLKPSTALVAKRFFQTKLKLTQRSDVRPCMVHSDLGTNNLLVDFDQPSLTAVIDFSDLAWGDPAVDFAGFYRNFGRDFVERLLRFYAEPIGDHFWDRVKYEAMRKQFFVIYFANKFGFENHIPAVVQNIERLFSTLTSQAPPRKT